MYCKSSSCNKEIPEGSVYCPHCGIISESYRDESTAKSKVVSKINDITYVDGIPEFNKNSVITLKLHKDKLECVNKLHFQDKLFCLNYDELDKVVFYGGTGSTILKHKNGEIILRGKQHKFMTVLEQYPFIKVESIGEVIRPKRPTGITIIAILGIGFNAIFLLLLLSSFLDSDSTVTKRPFISTFYLAFTVLYILIFIGFLKAQKWSYDAYIFFAILSIFVGLFSIRDGFTLMTTLINTIVAILILIYLRRRYVKDYFTY